MVKQTCITRYFKADKRSKETNPSKSDKRLLNIESSSLCNDISQSSDSSSSIEYIDDKLVKSDDKKCVTHDTNIQELEECYIVYEKQCNGVTENVNETFFVENASEETTDDVLSKCEVVYHSVDESDINEFDKDDSLITDIKIEGEETFSTSMNADNSILDRCLTCTPKKTSAKRTHSASENSPNKKYYKKIVDEELVLLAVEHLNHINEDGILLNNFNLEKIYSSGVFNLNYSRLNTAASQKYEYNSVIIPTSIDTGYVFMIIVNVFTNSINCSYFEKHEIDFIFSMLTLSTKAQALLSLLIKRKHCWLRVDKLDYEDKIGTSNLIPICEELVKRSCLTSDIRNENISVLLHLLQVEEIRNICKVLKKDHIGKKQNLIENLLKNVETSKPLFPGAKKPSEVLHSLIIQNLGYCVRLTQNMIDIFDRMITLLIPNQDPQKTLSDIYLMFLNIKNEKIVYPKLPEQRYPIFSSKEHLLRYIEAKHVLTKILNAIEDKNWESAQQFGNLAYSQWLTILKNETESLENSLLPSHVKHFMPSYVWLKILSKSVESFKKLRDTIPRATEILNVLIEQKYFMQHKKAQWSIELALIEMHHRKNLEASALVTLKTLKLENLTEIDKEELLERTKKLLNRKKNGLTGKTREDMQKTLNFMTNKLSLKPYLVFEPPVINVSAALIKGDYGGTNRKSNWCIYNEQGDKFFSTVEDVALSVYYQKGFTGGVHCEGALPIILFFTLFWKEIYEINIPGSFVSLYQEAPLDLFTGDFYQNRKHKIDMKLDFFRELDINSLNEVMMKNFLLYKHCKSLMNVNLFSDCFEDIVECLGVKGVIGISKRLVDNFMLWRAGFPDLIVWNTHKKSCKIVEVKGPGDTLSAKQSVWLKYLAQLGLDVEVCLVQDNGNGRI